MIHNRLLLLLFLSATVFLTACSRPQPSHVSGSGTAAAIPAATEAVSPIPPDLPEITAVELDHPSLPRYESLEMTLSLDADYTNPYDAREVTLDGRFIAPDGSEMVVPGFWDGEEAWRFRFTPSQEGDWIYQLTITDERGTSAPAEGSFTVTPSDHHGWLQAGNWVNPNYSGHYLVHHDGTPFYGVGHADALNILIDGFDIERGVGLFDAMLEAEENYVVWWPLYSNSPISSYDDYSTTNMRVIDLVVRDAQQNGIYLVFTVWDHPQLRDDTHAWGTGNWANNGFSELGDLNAFFTSDEAWAWQENFYRYVIARWGYSPAIGLWQTVTEINGTNAYDQTNPWHEKVNAYFIAHDPYRHPTTASMSGDSDWPEGHQAMDAPQVHIYALEEGAVASAATLANWTTLMWDRAEKPNWVGEFGVPGNSQYPELFHNSIWAALATGAAMTPAEWNSGGNWMRMSREMYADNTRLARFVADLPLAQLNPSPLQLTSSDLQVRGWGLAGSDGGLFWVQDFSMEGQPIQELRANQTTREGVEITIEGLPAGSYTITPYDTWFGAYLPPFTITCLEGQPCTVPLPAFTADMAFKISGS